MCFLPQHTGKQYALFHLIVFILAKRNTVPETDALIHSHTLYYYVSTHIFLPLRSVIVTASYGALSFHLYVSTATAKYHSVYYAIPFHSYVDTASSQYHPIRVYHILMFHSYVSTASLQCCSV